MLLVLRPFVPVCFPARETALWPPSVNGQPAHQPVCQVALPPHSLGKMKTLTLNLLSQKSDFLITSKNDTKTPQWANRLISAASATVGFLLDAEWRLWHRHIKKKKNNPKKRSGWRSRQTWAGAAVMAAFELRAERIFSGSCVSEHKCNGAARQVHPRARTLPVSFFLRIAAEKFCWLLKMKSSSSRLTWEWGDSPVKLLFWWR